MASGGGVLMKGGTLFSGIGAPEVAAPWIEWRWAAEIDPFARAVHAARFPHIKNLGDVTSIDWSAVEPVDLIVAGPPCQDHSVAGKRAGLGGDRGNLTLVYVDALDAIDPLWSLTENVPGWLSLRDNAFGAFLGRLVGHDAPLVPGRGQRWTNAGVVDGPRRTAAWRVLDAQFFGLAQRRGRVFVLAVRGPHNRTCADALFPFGEGVHGDPAPRRETGQGAAAKSVRSTDGGVYNEDRDNVIAIADPLCANEQRTYTHEGRGNFRLRNVVPAAIGFQRNAGRDFTADADRAPPLRGDGGGWAGGGAVAIPLLEVSARTGRNGHEDVDGLGVGEPDDPMYTLQSGHQHGVAVAAFGGNRQSGALEAASALRAKGGTGHGDFESETFIIQAVQAERHQNGAGIGGGAMFTLTGQDQHAVAFESRFARNGRGAPEAVVPPLKAQSGQTDKGDSAPLVSSSAMSVRRLMPIESERLQGFPDNFTLVTYRRAMAADGPRYRVLGNSMAVPCIAWILRRLLAAGF